MGAVNFKVLSSHKASSISSRLKCISWIIHIVMMIIKHLYRISSSIDTICFHGYCIKSNKTTFEIRLLNPIPILLLSSTMLFVTLLHFHSLFVAFILHYSSLFQCPFHGCCSSVHVLFSIQLPRRK